MKTTELKPAIEFVNNLTGVNYAEIKHANEQLEVNCDGLTSLQNALHYLLSLNIDDLKYDGVKRNKNSGNYILYFDYN